MLDLVGARNRLAVLVVLILLITALTACGGAPESSVKSGSEPEQVSREQENRGDRRGDTSQDRSGEGERAEVPEDKTLRLTIPEMERVENAEVPDAAYDDEQSLRQNTAIHLRGTGFPWEEEANVYIAGHRLGYPSTGSFLAFYDLGELENGDEITVTDANGTKYAYEVFNEIIASPTDVHLMQPQEGKNILTLQTCTLPDYSKRIIVQAEIKES